MFPPIDKARFRGLYASQEVGGREQEMEASTIKNALCVLDDAKLPSEEFLLPVPRPEPVADIDERIRVGAYYLAEKRGFAPGRELEDWLAAEIAVTGRERLSS